MSQRIFRIVYCSRSRLHGSEAEVRAQLGTMLRTARASNARLGLTGALFFDTVFFAQVLEGDYMQVLRAFERVQLDPRHRELVILQCGYAAGRDFGDWAMAFAGTFLPAPLPFGTAPRHEAEFTGNSRTGESVLAFLRETVIRAEAWVPSGR